MTGSEKQIAWANKIIANINKQIDELKQNKKYIVYYALRNQAEVNGFLEDDQLRQLLLKLNPRIIEEFNKLINDIELKLNSYTKAGDIINDLKTESIQSLYKNMDYIYITNAGIETWKKHKKHLKDEDIIKHIQFMESIYTLK